MAEVSVVIPTYNRAHTLLRAIRSVQAQSFTDWELIVVDDASTDATLALLAELGEPRLKILRHEVNRGAAAARNTGLGEAGGAYIAFLDSDDEWLPEKLAIQVAELASQPPGTDVCCSGVVKHLLHHGIVHHHHLRTTSDWFRRLALDCDLSPGSTLLARRAAFARVGLLDESLRRFEDWDWLLRYAGTGLVHAIGPPLAIVYNQRGRLGEQWERSAELFLAKHRQLYASLSGRDRRQAVANIWLQVVGTYAFEGKPLSAARASLKALKQRPIHASWRIAVNAARYVTRVGRTGAMQ